MTRLYFEDFTPGWTLDYGGETVTRDNIVAFARAYDPQPFHLDEEAAKRTFVGALIASGWHTCALMMRMITQSFILDSSSMGAPGVDEVKWLRPVRPGDTLKGRTTVLDRRESRSRPEMGFVQMRTQLFNQRDEAVYEQTNWGMFGRRGQNFEMPRIARTDRTAPKRVPEDASDDDSGGVPYFEDVAIGTTRRLGSATFQPDDIVRFATVYDPQPFHVDAEAARRSHFGELCASGWQTGAVCMRLIVEHRKRVIEAARERGETIAATGSSPGFSDLKWLKPVYAGDTITYRSTLADKRASASRPDWGLVFTHNTGDNQFGERVFEFKGSVFWQRRGS